MDIDVLLRLIVMPIVLLLAAVLVYNYRRFFLNGVYVEKTPRLVAVDCAEIVGTALLLINDSEPNMYHSITAIILSGIFLYEQIILKDNLIPVEANTMVRIGFTRRMTGIVVSIGLLFLAISWL